MKKRFHDKLSPQETEILADHTRLLDTVDILGIGMGWFFSIKGFIAILVAVIGVSSISEEIEYGLKKEPMAIESIDSLASASHNDFIEFSLPLDYANSIQSRTVGGISFSLTPVKGMDGKVVIYREGVLTTEETKNSDQDIQGKVIRKDFSDEWNMGILRLDVPVQFARANVDVHEDVLVVADGYLPKIEAWPIILLFIFCIMAIWFLQNLTRTARFFIRRDHLAAYLNRKLRTNT